jgi:succinyl-diaminopimelate desuccinylase
MFNFRFCPASTRESLMQRFETIVARHGLEYDLRWTGYGKPFLTPRGALVAAVTEAVREVTGIVPEISCTGGTSDGRFIADICDEVVELGPVNATIHKLNERVRIDDLPSLAAIYRRIVERLLLPARGTR